MDNNGIELSQKSIANTQCNGDKFSYGSKNELYSAPQVCGASIREKARTYKNLIFSSLAILFHYASFYAIGNLQSSIYREKSMGTISLAIIYAGKLVSNLFISTLVIGKLGCKKSIIICTAFFMFYTAANFKSAWYKYTMIPAAIISGIAGGPQMVAVKSYIALLARGYADLIKSTNYVAITSQFYGIYYMLYGSAEIWGNGLSSLILHTSHSNGILSKENLTCGANYCPTSSTNHTNLIPPNEIQVFILCGVCLGFELLAVLAPAIFIDKLKNDKPDVSAGFLALALKAFRQMRSPKQIILIPILIFRGLMDGFVVADFNLGFVSCTLGIEYIGTTMVCLGIVKAISSFLLGLLIRITGRMAVFLGSLIIAAVVLLLMLLWQPDPEMPVMFYLIAALLAVADGVIYSQTLALHSTIFHDNHEAAFSNCAVFQYVGHITAYATSAVLCIYHKLIFLIVVLILGTAGYIYVETLEILKERRKTRDVIPPPPSETDAVPPPPPYSMIKQHS